MKPYRIGDVWLDLDHIVGIDDRLDSDSYRRGDIAYANVRCLFREDAIEITLPLTGWRQDDTVFQQAKDTWEAFKRAWMTKETMFRPVKPS